jgi:hypothetical protein
LLKHVDSFSERRPLLARPTLVLPSPRPRKVVLSKVDDGVEQPRGDESGLLEVGFDKPGKAIYVEDEVGGGRVDCGLWERRRESQFEARERG